MDFHSILHEYEESKIKKDYSIPFISFYQFNCAGEYFRILSRFKCFEIHTKFFEHFWFNGRNHYRNAPFWNTYKYRANILLYYQLFPYRPCIF